MLAKCHAQGAAVPGVLAVLEVDRLASFWSRRVARWPSGRGLPASESLDPLAGSLVPLPAPSAGAPALVLAVLAGVAAARVAGSGATLPLLSRRG